MQTFDCFAHRADFLGGFVPHADRRPQWPTKRNGAPACSTPKLRVHAFSISFSAPSASLRSILSSDPFAASVRLWMVRNNPGWLPGRGGGPDASQVGFAVVVFFVPLCLRNPLDRPARLVPDRAPRTVVGKESATTGGTGGMRKILNSTAQNHGLLCSRPLQSGGHLVLFCQKEPRGKHGNGRVFPRPAQSA